LHLRTTILGGAAVLAAGAGAIAVPAGAQTSTKFNPAAFTAEPNKSEDTTRDRNGRFAFRLTGTLVPSNTRQGNNYLFFPPGQTDPNYATVIGAGQACSGKVRITIERKTKSGRRTVYRRVVNQTVNLRSNCTVAATFRTKRNKATFRVRFAFLGNAVLNPINASRFTITTNNGGRRR
jgi:hypothetical protein